MSIATVELGNATMQLESQNGNNSKINCSFTGPKAQPTAV
jgi:hypothetical protein